MPVARYKGAGRWVALAALLALWALPAQAQIDFRGFFPTDTEGDYTEGYEIDLVVDQGLDFGLVIMGQPDPVVVTIDDVNQIGILQITAVRYMDIYVSVDAPLALESVETTDEIPVSISVAYANTGPSSSPATAIEMPGLQGRLPVFQRPGGPPGPPPVPPHANYVPPRETLFLYFYGSLGPVPSGIQAGAYEAQIVVQVNYEDI